jgi:hypothetical protein
VWLIPSAIAACSFPDPSVYCLSRVQSTAIHLILILLTEFGLGTLGWLSHQSQHKIHWLPKLCNPTSIILNYLMLPSVNNRNVPKTTTIHEHDSTVWSDYVEVAHKYDERMVTDLNKNLDIVLIFVSGLMVVYASLVNR